LFKFLYRVKRYAEHSPDTEGPKIAAPDKLAHRFG
jgi:hypothetical protein